MNKRNTYFPLSILCLVTSLAVCLTSCSSGTVCRIDGTVRDKAYDGKTVYLCETYGHTAVDSTMVSHSSFRFNLDGLAQDVYLLKLKATPDDLFPITLPVVAEKGRIRVALGEIVYTSGTPLNDVTQDFLLAVDRYSDNMQKMRQEKTPEELRAGFSELLEGFILQNKDNCIGPYICRSYSTRLTPEGLARIKEQAGENFMEQKND